MDGTVERLRRISHQPTQYDQLVFEILQAISYLFKMRLVDYVCRPIDVSKKHSYVAKYSSHINKLHQNMQKLKADFINQISSAGKVKSSNKGTKPLVNKLDIKKIESRYTQVLIDGSFKYYQKAANVYNLQAIECIDIQEWSEQCLNKMGSGKQSCCC